jgi:hypothetical protein
MGTMNSQPSREHRGTTRKRGDDEELDTYVVRLPRWPVLVRLLGRDPLVRTTDRVEALVSVVTVVVTLLAVPLAAAIGTEVYDSRRHVYAAQAPTRHIVSATVTEGAVAVRGLSSTTITVQARWEAAGAEHSGPVKTLSTVEPGDFVDIWVDDDGAQTPAPTSATRAAGEAVTIALLLWIGFAAAAAGLFTVTRAVCHRIRSAGWQRFIDGLVGDGGGGGRTNQV